MPIFRRNVNPLDQPPPTKAGFSLEISERTIEKGLAVVAAMTFSFGSGFVSGKIHIGTGGSLLCSNPSNGVLTPNLKGP